MTDKNDQKVFFHWKNKFKKGKKLCLGKVKKESLLGKVKNIPKSIEKMSKQRFKCWIKLADFFPAQEGVLFTYLKPLLQKSWQSMMKHERQSKLMFGWMY